MSLIPYTPMSLLKYITKPLANLIDIFKSWFGYGPIVEKQMLRRRYLDLVHNIMGRNLSVDEKVKLIAVTKSAYEAAGM